MKNKNIHEIFILFFLGLSGVSTGTTIQYMRQMKHAQNKTEFVAPILLSAGCAAYSARRAYKIYQDKQK